MSKVDLLKMLLHIAPALVFAAWEDIDDLNTGDVLTESTWDKLVDNFAVLKTHTHDGTTGGGGALGNVIAQALDSIPTATENDLSWVNTLTHEIGAASLYAGSVNDSYLVEAWYKVFNGTGSAKSWAARLVFGGTTVAESAVTGTTATGTRYVLVRGFMRANDSHDVQAGLIERRILVAAVGNSDANFQHIVQDDGTGAEVNSGNALDLKLDFKNTTADLNLSHQAQYAIFRRLTGG
jgi:hypothetical protein